MKDANANRAQLAVGNCVTGDSDDGVWACSSKRRMM